MLMALVIDDNAESMNRTTQILIDKNFSVETAETLDQARSALLKKIPELVLFNMNMDEKWDYRRAHELFTGLDHQDVMAIYLISNKQSYKCAVNGMRIGATDFFVYPDDFDRLGEVLTNINIRSARNPINDDYTDEDSLGLLLGRSKAMKRLYHMLRKVAPSETTVLLAGDSGTGKELAAKTLHHLSRRSACPIVSVNCGAISKELIESELFGHVKGAFTGAIQAHDGFFMHARGGTLFLDEITEMDLDLQVKLLRVLEAKELYPVGSGKVYPIDVRIIASTNRNPQCAVKEGKLREDLYYRLAQFPILIPNLRERGDDVILLANNFLAEQIRLNGISKTFHPDTLELLRLYDWPGNVRELKNIIARAYILSDNEIIPEDLSTYLSSGKTAITVDPLKVAIGNTLAEVERQMIIDTLEHYDGDKPETARVLGISLKTLYNRLKDYG